MRKIYDDFYMSSVRAPINVRSKRPHFCERGISGADAFNIYQTCKHNITGQRLASITNTDNYYRILLFVGKKMVYLDQHMKKVCEYFLVESPGTPISLHPSRVLFWERGFSGAVSFRVVEVHREQRTGSKMISIAMLDNQHKNVMFIDKTAVRFN